MSKRFLPSAGQAPSDVRASWPSSKVIRMPLARSSSTNGPVIRSQGVPTYTSPTRDQVWANARRFGQA